MRNIAISTAAFCLWDIGPERKLQICKDFGFEHVVIAFSTLKMLKQFSSSDKLCQQLSSFKAISIHAPWRGIKYKNNKATKEIVDCLNLIMDKVSISTVIFHFDCIEDFQWLKTCQFDYCIKNPARHSWDEFNTAIEQHGFDSVLDINRATRFEDYMDQYLQKHSNSLKAVHVSGYMEDLGRTPIVESGQQFLLDKLKPVDAPMIIEGLFSPGDFQSIRDEIQVIQERIYCAK
ncbi:MAG: hypothetical protein JXO44_12750 [Clostridia bacterium]|nr:hypothetical protein [Clostridia bacterium]